MINTYLYRDPFTGRTTNDPNVPESEAAGALAVTRAQAEDSLSARLLDVDKRVLETQTAIDLSTQLYGQAVTDPDRKGVYQVKKPISPVLIAVAVYLVMS